MATLQRNPPGASFYLDGMNLGTGIDAITGEMCKSALDDSFEVVNVTSANSADTFSFRMTVSVEPQLIHRYTLTHQFHGIAVHDGSQ